MWCILRCAQWLSDHMNHHSRVWNTREQDSRRCLNSFENKIKSIRNYGKRLKNILKSRLVRMRSAVQIRSAAPQKPLKSSDLSGFLVFDSFLAQADLCMGGLNGEESLSGYAIRNVEEEYGFFSID